MGERVFDLPEIQISDHHGGRGPSPYVVTDQNWNRVSLLIARCWSSQRIADAMLISLPILAKYYFLELSRCGIERDGVEAWLDFKIWQRRRLRPKCSTAIG